MLRQFASPYFVARSPGMLNVQEVRLASPALWRLVWLATCHSARLKHYQSTANLTRIDERPQSQRRWMRGRTSSSAVDSQ